MGKKGKGKKLDPAEAARLEALEQEKAEIRELQVRGNTI